MTVHTGVVVDWDSRSGGNLYVEGVGRVWVPVTALFREEATQVEIGYTLTTYINVVAETAYVNFSVKPRYTGTITKVVPQTVQQKHGYLLVRVDRELANMLGLPSTETLLFHHTNWNPAMTESIIRFGQRLVGQKVYFQLGSYLNDPRATDVQLVDRDGPNKTVGYWLYMADNCSTASIKAEAMANAVGQATFSMLTHLGMVLAQQAPDDPDHWSIYLVDGQGLGKALNTGGKVYATSLTLPAEHPLERSQAAGSLLKVMDFLMTITTPPESLRNALVEHHETLRNLLKTYFR